MRLCKHTPHTVVDWVKEPKYSTREILLNKDRIDHAKEHLIIRFSDAPSMPEWFYMSRTMVRRHKVSNNGRIEVYAVPLAKREPFEIIKPCEHAD